MAGYSNKPLINKLGVKKGMTALFVNVPENYFTLLEVAPDDFVQQEKDIDFIHFFTRSQEALREEFGKLKAKLKPTGMLWISWPKSSCSFANSNLTDNTVRDIGLEHGLVDIKVAAIDEDWSGIKFVYRLKDRK